MGNLLKDLRTRASPEDTARINDVLQSVDEAMSNNRFTPSSSNVETASEGLDTMSTTSIDTESLGLNDIYDPLSSIEQRYEDRDQLGLWPFDPELHQQTQVVTHPDGHPTVDGIQPDNLGMFLDPNQFQHYPFR